MVPSRSRTWAPSLLLSAAATLCFLALLRCGGASPLPPPGACGAIVDGYFHLVATALPAAARKSQYSEHPAECGSTCAQHFGAWCKGYTYNHRLKRCYFKASTAGGRRDVREDAFLACHLAAPPPPAPLPLLPPLTSSSSSTAAAAASSCGAVLEGYRKLPLTALTGVALASSRARDPLSCAATCEGLPQRCEGFTFERTTGWCHYKAAAAGGRRDVHADSYIACRLPPAA